MKAFLSFLLLISLSLVTPSFSANARSISNPEARMAAGNFLKNSNYLFGFQPVQCSEIIHDGQVLAYAFELDPPGYLVIAAYSWLPPVIAYSGESPFGQLQQKNPLYSMIQADLSGKTEEKMKQFPEWIKYNESRWSELLAEKKSLDFHRVFEQWPASGDGWLKTNWTQNPPYNNMCPMDPVTGLRSYAGCPATAMAQIMNYHNTTNFTHFSDNDDYYHNYAGRQYWIDDDFDYADFPSFPELNTYLDSLNEHYLTNQPLTNDDKAALTFACAIAARQVFTSQGSGTFGVDQAYDAYLRFGCSTVELLDSTDADLFERLKQNIKDTLPAHLAVVNESWTTGHNVVVDGYNTDDYYHLNFGWGGSYNGWYLLPDEIPYDLTVIEGVVVDIMKNPLTGENESAGLKPEIKICPNPVTTATEIRIFREKQENFSFCLYNLCGDEIMQFHCQTPANFENTLKLDLSRFPAGYYVYRLIFSDEIISGKLIKAQ